MTETRHQEAVKGLPKQDGYYTAIGRFMVEFSAIENLLRKWVADKIGIDQRFREKLMTHDYSMICNVASQVLPEGRLPEEAENIRKLVARCYELNEHRVRIAHGYWRFGWGNQDRGLRHASRTKLVEMTYYKDPSEVAAVADRARQARNDIVDEMYM